MIPSPLRHLRHRRVRAALVHLLLSAAVAAIVAVLVFRLWYPYPYAAIAGGAGLFFIVVAVDVCLGPALTAVVAAPAKPLPELRRDLAVIVAGQLAGLAYGVHALAVARPVYLSFEIDRCRVVSAVDVDADTLDQAPAALRDLPWTGPQVIAAVKPTDPDERLKSIELGLAGFDLSMLPKNWREYRAVSAEAWTAARPLPALLSRHPEQAPAAATLAGAAGTDPQALRVLPVMSRRASWTAVLAAPDARIVGFLPVDGFF